MIYKGYTIFADVNSNEQWDIEEDDLGHVSLTGYRDSGGADEDGIADFQIEDEDGEQPEWAEDYYETLADAKSAIDKAIKDATTFAGENGN